jgi:hypothetical protein
VKTLQLRAIDKADDAGTLSLPERNVAQSGAIQRLMRQDMF